MQKSEKRNVKNGKKGLVCVFDLNMNTGQLKIYNYGYVDAVSSEKEKELIKKKLKANKEIKTKKATNKVRIVAL